MRLVRLWLVTWALIFNAFPDGCLAQSIDVWPDLAPGETTRLSGTAKPPRAGEVPPVTRLENITRPSLTVFKPEVPNGTAVIILPGGGFSIVVPDKEGSEAAEWLNSLGVTAFVLNYRTKNSAEQLGWDRALQDTQRSVAVVRARAAEFGIQPTRIGLLGFSAGGQIAARLLSDAAHKTYAPIDTIDGTSHRPDFALLIYPWNIYDNAAESLVEGISVKNSCPPTFLVHTHDDKSSSLGAVLFYAGLKKLDIAAELHVYGNGGHGYGVRDVEGSQISGWVDHAGHWLHMLGF